MNRFLHICSQSRSEHSTAAEAEFLLPQPIRSIKRFKVKYVQFTNKLHNITSFNNKFVTNLQNVTITPGYYRSEELVAALPPGVCTLGEDSELNWTMAGEIINFEYTTLKHVLGFTKNGNLTGNFTTLLQLQFPASVSLYSPQLHGPQRERVIYAGKHTPACSKVLSTCPLPFPSYRLRPIKARMKSI